MSFSLNEYFIDLFCSFFHNANSSRIKSQNTQPTNFLRNLISDHSYAIKSVTITIFFLETQQKNNFNKSIQCALHMAK